MVRLNSLTVNFNMLQQNNITINTHNNYLPSSSSSSGPVPAPQGLLPAPPTRYGEGAQDWNGPIPRSPTYRDWCRWRSTCKDQDSVCLKLHPRQATYHGTDYVEALPWCPTEQ
jgi:hypothetical protein